MFTKQLLQIALIAQSFLSSLATLSVTVDPEDEICFAFKTPGNDPARISGNFDIFNEGELSNDPVIVVLFNYDTEKVVWYSKKGTAEGSFNIVDTGKFHLCIGNGSTGDEHRTSRTALDRMTRLHGHPNPTKDPYPHDNDDNLPRTVGFEIRVHPVEGTELHHFQKGNSVKEDVQTIKIEDLTYELIDKVDLLLDHQEYIKGREVLHRHIVEQTFTMVMRWTLLEVTVLISVATAQIWYLKRFFETKRFM